MSETENKKLNLLEKIKQNKKLQMVIIAVLALLAFIIVFETFSSENKTEDVAMTVERYVDDLESRLSKTLRKVDGAGEVSVVLTVESGMQTVLASKTTTTKTDSGTEIVETPIIVNGKTVVLKELYPEIKGVLIVAEGASNIQVLSKLQQATVSLLGVSANKIEILTMK